MYMDKGKALKINILYPNDGLIANYSDFPYHGGLNEAGSTGSHIWISYQQLLELFGKD